MATVIVRTFWVWHKDADEPDCELGWTQWGVDDNPDGWEKEKADVLARYGSGIHSSREIEVRLDHDEVLKHWWPDPIEGVVASRDTREAGS